MCKNVKIGTTFSNGSQSCVLSKILKIPLLQICLEVFVDLYFVAFYHFLKYLMLIYPWYIIKLLHPLIGQVLRNATEIPK